MSIEELLKIKISSVSKTEELVEDSSAAIYIITAEDIRRSGLTQFAELMRMVPGMQVAQRNSNVWGISTRGFNNTRTPTMLVLIDGRSVYSPLFAGVFWDQHDYLLKDIERIEVIRGSGGAIWGTNAFNGVVNIITKSAQNTQGVYASARLGQTEKGIAEFRYGGTLGEKTNYRIFGKSARYDGFVFSNSENQDRTDEVGGRVKGDDSFDDWKFDSLGMRVDHNFSNSNQIFLQMEAYDGVVDDSHNTDDEEINGEMFNLKWQYEIDANENFYLQTYYNHFFRIEGVINNPNAPARELFVNDTDFVYSKQLASHKVTLGAGFRNERDERSGVIPEKRNADVYRAFVQDAIQLEENLVFSYGVKFEQNDYTGRETQPNISLLWHASDKHSIWTSLNRNIRMPTRLESDDDTRGWVDLNAESVIRLEIGHRFNNFDNFYIDSTAFYADYDKLVAIDDDLLSASSDDPYDNILEAVSFGLESTITYQILDDWKVAAAYSYLKVDTDVKQGFVDKFSTEDRYNKNYPTNQFNLRSYLNYGDLYELDTFVYFVDRLDSAVTSGTAESIPSYIRVDLRFGWKNEDLELSLGVQNLLDENHDEFNRTSRTGTSIERNYYLQLQWMY